GRERLGDVVDDAHHFYEALADLIALRAHQDHWNIAELGVGGEPATKLVAGHLRHHEVEQDQIRARLPDRGGAGLDVARGLDLVSRFGQHQLHHLGDGGAVIDHENPLAGHVGISLTLRDTAPEGSASYVVYRGPAIDALPELVVVCPPWYG